MKRLLLGFFFAASTFGASAQFTPASVPTTPYPSSPDVLRPNELHCYTASVYISGSTYELYVYGWNSAGTIGEGFAWRLMSGTTLVNAGTIPIPNSSSIDMGIVNEGATNTVKVVVGYHKTGTGHFLDIYDASLGGLILSSSTALSGSSALPRIAVDAHKLYGVLVAWSDPAAGIQVMTLDASGTGYLTPGITHTLNGTVKCVDPDITFSHDNTTSVLKGHVVFHRGTPNRLEEQGLGFFAMQGSSIVPYSGVTEDVYPIPAGSTVGLASIDAPEHGIVENWGYAFEQPSTTSGLGPILARVHDATAGIVNQFDVTEGSYGINPSGPYDFSHFFNSGPCLAFDQDENFFRVAWAFTQQNPVNGKYLVQKMKTVNGSLVNPGATYLEAEVTPANNLLPSRCIAITGNNSFTTDFCAYGFLDNTGNYSINVKSLPWTLPTFKSTGVTQVGTVQPDFAIYPNPASTAPIMSFAGALGDEQMDAVMLNTSGQVVASAHGNGNAVSIRLLNQWSGLPAGQYVIRIVSVPISFDRTKPFTKL